MSLVIKLYFFCFQIEGTFQMNTPRHLLGYERHISNSESSHYRNSTFLSLFIMAQPPLHPPEPIKVNIMLSLLKLNKTMTISNNIKNILKLSSNFYLTFC